MAAEHWSPAVGLRRAALALLVRSLICLPIWAAVVWLVTPALNLAPLHWTWLLLLGLILAVPGASIGHALARDITERAGFASMVLTALAAVFAWGVVAGGVELAGLFKTLEGWRPGVTATTTGVFATLWIVKLTLLD